MIGWEKLMFSDEFSSILAKFEAFLTLFLLSLDGRSEYWDAIAIMEYKDRASFCRMVSLNSVRFPVSLLLFHLLHLWQVLSNEWSSVLKYKIAGLADTHTYLASSIPRLT